MTAINDKAISIRDEKGVVVSFGLSAVLARGDCLADGCYSYRWSDVRMGDKVGLFTSRTKGVLVCDEICIRRRPGGLVPPAPGEESDTLYPWHDTANAEQAREEGRDPPPKTGKQWPKSKSKPFDWTRFLPNGVFTPPLAPPPRPVHREQ